MTTRGPGPSFDFTGFDEASQTFSRDDARVLLGGPELAGLLPPGTIGTQAANQGAGIPIGAIRRGLLGPLYGRTTSNYSITATSFAEVDSTNLAGVLVCTGRPVIVLISALVNRSSTLNTFTLSVSMDGAEITGTADGMGLVDLNASPDFNLVNWRILTPRPGPRRFALVAKVSGGNTTIWSSTDDVVQLAVVEL